MSEVYIPKDLDDSIETLTGMLFDEDYQALRSGTEEDILMEHHYLGRHLRNEWGLWQDSRLAKWFNEKGIHHADDMSSIILTSFWREANSELIKLDEQIKHYQDFWKKQNEKSDGDDS